MARHDIPLESTTADVCYGDKGPDKWAFQMEGVLDEKYEGRDHEFTVDGKKMKNGYAGRAAYRQVRR